MLRAFFLTFIIIAFATSCSDAHFAGKASKKKDEAKAETPKSGNIVIQKQSTEYEVESETGQLPANVTGAFLSCIADHIDLEEFRSEISCALYSTANKSRLSAEIGDYHVISDTKHRFEFLPPRSEEWDVLVAYQGEDLASMKSDLNAAVLGVKVPEQAAAELEIKSVVSEQSLQPAGDDELSKLTSCQLKGGYFMDGVGCTFLSGDGNSCNTTCFQKGLLFDHDGTSLLNESRPLCLEAISYLARALFNTVGQGATPGLGCHYRSTPGAQGFWTGAGVDGDAQAPQRVLACTCSL